MAKKNVERTEALMRIAVLIVTGIILSLLGLLLSFLNYSTFIGGIGIISALVILWFYFAYMESSKLQATVGKKVMGIKVTDLKGKQISFKTASLRFFTKLCSIWFKPNEKGQEYHDKISKCLVIKE